MPRRPLNAQTMSAATAAMFDLLADGRWRDTEQILQVGAAACQEHEADKARRRGEALRASTTTLSAEDLAAVGARDIARNNLMIASRSGRTEKQGQQHRLTANAATMWQGQRPHLTASRAAKMRRQYDDEPLIFAGVPEAEGWLLAPLDTCEMAHFRNDSAHDLPLPVLRRDLPDGWAVEFDHEEDLYRVYGRAGHTDGAALHAFLTGWCRERQINPKGLRVESDYRRRQIKDLPEAFLADLCKHYHVIGMRRAQRHMSSIALHYSDSADISQAVYMQILQAVSRYDHSKGISFGAFLSAKLSHWAHGLARAQFGRTACEAELRQQRAIASFQHEHNRAPDEAELAGALKVTVDAIRETKQTLAVINGLRNMQPLSVGPDAVEIPLPDESLVSDQMLHDEEQSLLSQALTASCAADVDDDPNVLGWITWYFTTWGGLNKQSLASTLKTSPRNMNAHADRARAKMAERLSA